MGIENMRRWPVYIVFAVCILLTLSLFNSWSLETELRNRIAEISIQLQDCSKQQTQCTEDSLALLEQKEGYASELNQLRRQKSSVDDELRDFKDKAVKAQSQMNHTLVDVELCKTELQSLKNLQLSKSATLETLRLEKETLGTQLSERKQRIEELEKEIERLKAALTTKSGSSPSASSKVTPAAAPSKMSSSLHVHHPINEPVLENDAKEELEDTNAIIDGDNFDPQVQQ